MRGAWLRTAGDAVSPANDNDHMDIEARVELAREWCVSYCQYSHARTEAILRAVRRTGRHGRDLDDEAWAATQDGPGLSGARSLAWLEAVT